MTHIEAFDRGRRPDIIEMDFVALNCNAIIAGRGFQNDELGI